MILPLTDLIGKARALRRLLGYVYARQGVASTLQVKVHGLLMSFPKDSVSLALVMASGLYEKLTTSIFRMLIKPKSTVVDLGASFGYYTLLAAQLVGDSGHIYAFEPEPIRYNFLLRNIRINNFTNVTAINKAISDKSGRRNFFIRGEMSSLSPNLDYSHQITVETVSLDEYFGSNRKINAQTLIIKMDIEGSEFRALLGMEALLKSNQNLTLITEFAPNLIEASGDQPRDFVRALAEHGFKLFVIDELRLKVRRVNADELIAEAERTKNYSTNLLCIRRK